MSGKKFLLILFSSALVVWIGGNVILGPPTFSAEYKEKYGQEHERYIEISKNSSYKLYLERPEIHGPESAGADPHLAEYIEFMEMYEARDEFHAEEARLHKYEYFFELFNAAIVVILCVFFARKPMANMLDEKIGELKEKLATAAEARASSEARKAEVEDKLSQLSEEEKKVTTATALRLQEEQAALEQSNTEALERIRQEIEDRKREEWLAAERLVREELVGQSIAKLQAQYGAALEGEGAAAQQAQVMEQFMADLEARS